MKLAAALVASFFTGALSREISISEVKADSKFGMDLLSKARRVEDADEADATWIAGFALKFQGCHHITQWNAEADGDEDVRIETRRLARFRLCPVSSCKDTSGFGCKSGYGDYIVDMDDFLYSFYENKVEEEQAACEKYMEYNCNCDDNGQYGDYYTEEDCLAKCYKNAGMSECIEEEAEEVYYNGEVVPQVDVADYLACSQYGGRRRKLEDAGDDAADGDLFIGPYCSDQGGKIVLGMFTDDACTEFADDYGGRQTYRSLTGGQDLPYSSDSIVDTKCYSCEDTDDEAANYYSKNNGKYYDADGNEIEAEVKETCTELYEASGKCEEKLSWYGFSGNSNACTYIEGIKITRSDGLIIRGRANSNKVASAFISLFGLCFVGLGSYVYYLKTKLDRGTLNLNN